jgi:hypothetical protein
VEGILASGFAQGGFAFILGIVLVAIFTGRLVPKAQVDRMEVSYLAQIENWKATVAAEAARSETLMAQQQRLMEIVYQAAAASGERRSGGPVADADAKA